MVNHLTGLNLSKKEMMKIGERNYNLIKLLSIREGVTRENDGLHQRLEELLKERGSKGQSIPKKELQQKINQYYELRGWNEEGSINEKLKELNIENLAIK